MESCIASCAASNFTLAGLEFSVQCCKDFALSSPNLSSLALTVCDDNVINAGTLASADSDCDMGCGGNATYALFITCHFEVFVV